jgi:hypothetical protein
MFSFHFLERTLLKFYAVWWKRDVRWRLGGRTSYYLRLYGKHSKHTEKFVPQYTKNKWQ